VKVIYTPKLKQEPLWIFNYIEKYSHLNLKIKFKNPDFSQEFINFTIELGVQGFDGQILYIYMVSPKRIKFDLINHPNDDVSSHSLANLSFKLNKDSSNTLNLAITLFGHFKSENKLSFAVTSEVLKLKYSLYAWTPSFLFKNVKSLIKINNQYVKIIPASTGQRKSYNFGNWFKGNDSGHLLDLINHLTNYEEYCNVSEIKGLVSKANEYLFEISENQSKNIIKELERLRYNVKFLSREEIVNWINDIIKYYSDKM
jgi:hypothetical protein